MKAKKNNIPYLFAKVMSAGTALLIILAAQLKCKNLANAAIISPTLIFAAGSALLLFLLLLFSVYLAPQKLSVKLTGIDVLLMIWGFYLLIRIAFAEERMITPRAIDLLSLSCCYILLRRGGQQAIHIALYALCFTGIVQALYGLLQLYDLLPSDGPFKMTGSFFNLGAYSAFISMSACTAAGLLFFPQFSENCPVFWKKLPLLNLLLSATVLPASMNRASWIAILAVLIFFYCSKRKLSLSLLTLKYLISATVLSIGLLAAVVIGFKRDSASGRVLIWRVTAGIIREHAVFGVGYDRFQSAYMNYQASYLKSGASEHEKLLADNVYYAFNDPLQLCTELGLCGLLMAAALILAGLKFANHGDISVVLGKGIALSYFCISLFFYPHFILALKIPLMLSLAMLALYSKPCYTGIWFTGVAQLSKLLLLIPTLLIFACYMNYLWKLKNGYRQWKLAATAYQSENYQSSLLYFREALPVLRRDGLFLSQFGKAYLLADSATLALPLLEESRKYLNNSLTEIAMGDASKQLGNYRQAECHYQNALNMVPNRLHTEYQLLKLYLACRDTAKVCSKAKEILAKKIKIPSTAIRQIVDSARLALSSHHCTYAPRYKK